jgi:hypothetical protein
MAIAASFTEETSFLPGGLTKELGEHARPTSRIACHSLKMLPFNKEIVQRPPSSEKCGNNFKIVSVEHRHGVNISHIHNPGRRNQMQQTADLCCRKFSPPDTVLVIAIDLEVPRPEQMMEK